MSAAKRPKRKKRRAREAASPPPEPAPRRSVTTWLRISAVIGVAAAAVIAVLVNILASRHYRRWDFTEVGLYTLSIVTEKTLAGLREPVEVVVILPSSDPLALTVRHLLEAYQGQTEKIRARYVDPYRSPAEFFAVQQKYGIVAGKTDEGRVVTDAALIVVQGERKHFITAADLIEVETGEELRARPKVEGVVTAALRKVSAGKAPRVCITSGHGEPSIDEGGSEGLLALRSALEKSNHSVEALPPLRDVRTRDPIDACAAVVVAAPGQPLGDDEVERLVRFVKGGGNALVFAGPVPDEREKGYVEIGLGPLLALAGVRKNRDFVFERDDARRSAQGFGETFVAEPKLHAITQGFVDSEGAVGIVLTVASSLARLDDASVEPTPLLTTSERSFGMADFFAWADDPSEPEPGPRDTKGPLTLAFAAELPKTSKDAPHGPRMVIIGSNSAVYGANWQSEPLRGTAQFVEGAVSWLVAEPVVLDIPNKPARAVGLTITEDALRWTFVKLVLLLPGAALLLGAAVTLRRRASEGRSRSRRRIDGADERGAGGDDGEKAA